MSVIVIKPALVRFQDVGRDKRTWEEVLPFIDHRTALAAIKRKKALVSKSVEIVIEPDGTGQIYAGDRLCGRLTWKEIKEEVKK